MITTSLYGLIKPEDNDSADLRIFVGENMDILEAKLNEIENKGITEVSWDIITGKPTTFTPTAHSHDFTEIENVPSAFTPTAHTHLISEISGLQAELNDKSAVGHSHSWTEITGKPTTFAPASHSHSWTEITAKPSSFTPSSHVHSAEEITSGYLSIDRLVTSNSYSYQNSSTLATSYAVKMLNDKVDGKADASHTHLIAQITGLTTELNNKANAVHTHSWSDITGVPTFDNYNSWHLNAGSSVYSVSTSINSGETVYVRASGLATVSLNSASNILTIGASVSWDDVANKPTSFTPSSHVHSADDITSGFMSVDRLSSTGRFYLSQGARAATIEGYNSYAITDGLAGVAGRTASAGNGYLGTYRNGRRAGVYGEAGNYDTASTYAGYFDGDVYINEDINIEGYTHVNKMKLGKSGSIYGNNGDYIINDHGNGNVSLSAQGGDLFIGLYNTNNLRFNVPVRQEAWTYPSLYNGWTNFGSGFHSVGYKKDTSGNVQMIGVLRTGGSLGATIFTLPIGYRPSRIRTFSCISGDKSTGRINVYEDGRVVCIGYSDSWLGLDNISFHVD